MQRGQAIEIQLVNGEGQRVRLANVLPIITMFSGGHRHYVFDLRPTGTDGRTTVDWDDLELHRREAGLTSLMDYNTPLTALDSFVEVSVPSESYLRDRAQWMEESDQLTRPAWVVRWPVNGCLSPVKPTRVTPEGPLTHVDILVSLPV